MRVSKLASKIVQENEEQASKDDLDQTSVLKQVKNNIKFVSKNLSETRTQLSDQLGADLQ